MDEESKSIFTPKEVRVSTEVTVPEKGPLGELAEDQKTVSTFEFYFNKILSGELTSVQELRARFGQKFKRDASLADEQGNTVFDQRGYSIFVPDFEQLKLTDPEQRILLEELYEEISSASNEQKLAGDSIRIFNFYTTKILSGELTSVQELRARFGQKFKRDASLADEQGNTVFDQRGYSIFVPDFEQLKLTDPEQRILLEELYEEISSASNEQKLAGDSIRIFNFYTTKILSGELTSVQELRARFGQKFKRDASLADEQGNTVFDQRGYSIFVPDFEQLKLTDPEQRILLEELYELTNTSGTSDEVKNLLRVCIKEDNVLAGKDNTALTRLRSILAERNDPLSSKIEDFISRFDITKRRLALRQDFYSTLNSETVEEAFRVLGLYEGQDVSDHVLLKQLGSRALGVRRARVVGEFASTLASPTRDFDQALQKA